MDREYNLPGGAVLRCDIIISSFTICSFWSIACSSWNTIASHADAGGSFGKRVPWAVAGYRWMWSAAGCTLRLLALGALLLFVLPAQMPYLSFRWQCFATWLSPMHLKQRVGAGI